ncbi:hypothetical protein TcBrA4_0082970 [Trypanosoma cruzi]|nr:hypothetical protein TcBrA4_0082970 [Trypanosoma cruzi]
MRTGHALVNTLEGATRIPLPRDAVPREPRGVRSRMGIFPDRIRDPHAVQRIAAWDGVRCDGVGVFQPRRAHGAPDDAGRSALETACASLAPCGAGRWTDGFLSLAEHASGLAALPLDSPDGGAACGATPRSCRQPCALLPSGASCH